MTDNKFGWKVGDALMWSSPEGCDKSCVVTKATAQMIEFETEEGEVKRVKGNNPSIARIDDAHPMSESTTTAPAAKSETEAEPKLRPEPEPEMAQISPKPEMATEPAAKTDVDETDTEKMGDCASVAEGAFASSGDEVKVSERRAEVDLKSGGVVTTSVQVREGGSGLLAGDQEFRLNGTSEGDWHSSLEEALDAEYGRSWMCIRWQDK